MSPLMKSLSFHLLGPYLVHLSILLLILRGFGVEFGILTLYFGGWIVIYGMAIVSIPCGIAHIIQGLRYAPTWNSRRKQFLVGLLNPSLAILTIYLLLYYQPEFMFRMISD